jgi:hypothetical protein
MSGYAREQKSNNARCPFGTAQTSGARPGKAAGARRASIECLDRPGYTGTSIETVVEQSGMSRGWGLNQFQARPALMTATTHAAIQTIIDDV